MAYLITVFKNSFFNSEIKKQENMFNNYKLFSIFFVLKNRKLSVFRKNSF